MYNYPCILLDIGEMYSKTVLKIIFVIKKKLLSWSEVQFELINSPFNIIFVDMLLCIYVH